MRNLFTYLCLAIGMIATQQSAAQPNSQIQPINRFLKLNRVNSGTGTEKILVRSSNGLVKEVDKSLIVSSVNALQDLQSVLDTGKTFVGSGSFSAPYASFTNSYFGSNNIFLDANDGITVKSTIPSVQTKIAAGKVTIKEGNQETNIVATANYTPGSFSNVVNICPQNGTVPVIVNGYPAPGNNLGSFGMLMTDGNKLYICLSQGVWKEIPLN